MALYETINYDDFLANLARQDEEERLRKLQEQANASQAKIEGNNGGLGGFLGGLVGGIGKGIGDVGKGVFDLLGSGAAAVKDIAEGKAGTGENQKAFKQWLYDTDNLKDAYAKSAGTSLNAATTLATTAVPGLAGAGTAAGKALGGVAANTIGGAVGGIADELQSQGADASLESAANRAISGAAGGLIGGKVAGKVGNASSKLGGALLNNKLATSTLGRGAIAGAAGGAAGAGTSAALGGGDILGSTIQGATSGAMSGATQAGLTSLGKKVGTNARNRLWVTDIANGMEPPKTATTQELQNIVDEQYGLKRPELDATENVATEQPDRNVSDQNSKTSLAGQLRKKSAEKLLDQYGTISKPMAKSANAIENVQKVADAGFEKPGEVEDIISKITGSSGKVTKLTQNLVKSAKPVNTFDGINDLVDDVIANVGLVEGNETSIRKTIDAKLKSLPSRREGSVTYEDNPEDVFKVVKAIEKRSAELKGKSGTNYSTTTQDKLDQAKVLDTLADELKNRIYNNAAPVNTILTEEVASDLKSYAPNNKKWATYVDNVIMKSQNIGELRNSVAPFVNMGKIIDDQYINYGTYGQRVGDFSRDAGRALQTFTKIPFAGQAVELLANSNAAKRVASKGYRAAADLANKAREGQLIPNNTEPTQAASTPTTQTTNNDFINNFIARTQGNIAANNLVEGAKTAQEQQNLEGLLAEIQNSENNINAINLAQQQAQAQRQLSPLQTQLADIENGMNLALAAGDLQSYNTLASLYKNAYSIYQTQAKATQSEESNLSTAEKNQIAKLQSAGTALDQLESLYKKAGGGQGVIGGNIANFLGGLGLNSDVNTYNQLAQGLINQIGAAIGKTDSLNTEGEVQRALSLVPKITDDNQTAMNKLATLRSLLQTNTGTYNQLYGA